MNHQHSRANREIRNILLILSAAVLFAVLLCVYMIYTYGPSGQYTVSNALIAPSVAETMDFFEPSAGKTSARYVLDSINFSYYDREKKQVEKRALSPKIYEEFYDNIASDKSIPHASNDIEKLFTSPFIAKLVITVRNVNALQRQTELKTFQQVQFLEGSDYFRIQLHQQDIREHWIYIYHPGIYRDVINLFVK